MKRIRIRGVEKKSPGLLLLTENTDTFLKMVRLWGPESGRVKSGTFRLTIN